MRALVARVGELGPPASPLEGIRLALADLLPSSAAAVADA